MKSLFSLTVFSLLSLFSIGKIQAQVTQVNYQVQYNADECRYDAYIHIEQGSATGPQFFRLQSSTQFTIVVDSLLNVGNFTGYAPIANNGTVATWSPQNIIDAETYNQNPIVPGNTVDADFYGFIPSDNQSYYYDPLMEGDSVLIFSFTATPVGDCTASVRMWENGVDPDENYLGGPDFGNTFTMGGPQQKYNDNEPQRFPDAPALEAMTACATGLEIDLTVTSPICQEPYTYQWTGPSYSGTDEDVNIPNATEANAGTYKVVVTGALGCKDSLEVVAQVKPLAGDDFDACSNSTATLSGSQPTTGTWTASPDNATTIPVTNTSGGMADADLTGTPTGAYDFIYSSMGCSDTVTVNVNLQDAGPDPSDISCNETGTATLAGVGTGTWSVDPSSDGTAVIADPSSATTTVSDFSVGGTYILVWSNNGCDDTVEIDVQEICGCPISGNNLTPLAESEYCGNTGSLTIDGSPATPAGTYLWQQSTNGGAFATAAGSSNQEDYNITSLSTGTYTFRRIYSISSPVACGDTSNTVSLEVKDIPNPPSDITANPNPSCLGETVSVFVTNVSGTTYSWSAPADAGLTANMTNSVNLNPIVAGTYAVSVTATFDGCESGTTTIDIVVNATPDAIDINNVSSTNPSACAVMDGTISIAGLMPNTTYTLNYTVNTDPQTTSITTNGSGNVVISNLGAGTYSNFVLVTAEGCPSDPLTDQVTLTEPDTPDPPTGIMASPNPECAGEPVTIVVDEVDGATYSWSASSPDAGLGTSTTNTNVMVALAPGQYTVSVTQTLAGCTSNPISIGILINEAPPTPTEATVTSTNPTACGASDGTISISGLDAQGTYSVTYNAGGVAQTASGTSDNNGVFTIVGLTEGTYTDFQLSNFAGCLSGVFAGPVSLSDPGSPDAPANLTAVPSTICLGETVALSVDANPGATFNWSTNDIAAGLGTSTNNLNQLLPTAAGVYTISVSQTVAGCTSPSSSVTVTVLEVPDDIEEANITSTDPTVCAGSDGSITIAGYDAGITYDVSLEINGEPTTLSLTADGTGALTLSDLTAGTYSNFVITNAGDCSTNPFVGPISLVDPNAPDAPANLTVMPNPACVGVEVTLSVDDNQDATYMWTASAGNIIGTGSTVTFIITEAGSTMVSVTQTIAGCTSTAANTAIFGTAAPDDIESDDISVVNPSGCQLADGSILIGNLDANTFYRLNYDSLGVSVQFEDATDDAGVLTIPNLLSGSYSNFTLTNGSGCSSGIFAGPVGLVDPGAPDAPANISASPNPSCLGETVSISVDDVAGGVFTWDVNAAGAGLGTSTTNNITMQATESGTYTVSVFVTVAGCTSPISSIEVNVFDNPDTPAAGNFSSSDVTLCGATDGTITITGFIASEAYEVNYDFNGSPIVANVNADATGAIVLTGLDIGSYTNFQFTNSANCASGIFAGPIDIDGPPAPPAPSNLDAMPDQVCLGNSIQFSVDDTPGANFDWSISPAANANLSFDDNEASITPTESGVYTISVTQTVNGCTSPASTLDVTIFARPSNISFDDVSSVDPSGCMVADGSIALAGYDEGETYTVTFEFNMSPQSQTLVADAQGALTINGLAAGTYANFIVTDSNGCSSDPFAGPINLVDPGSPEPPTNLAASPDLICLGNDIALSVDGLSGATFNWSVSDADANLGNGNSSSNSLSPSSGGTYNVMVTQTVAGCTSPPSEVSVVVLDDCLNPDFGVTYGGFALTGKLSTNDKEIASSTYGNSVTSVGVNPSPALPTVQSDGSYDFSTEVFGKYRFSVDVCEPNSSTACISMPLVITVLDTASMENPPVVNHDYIKVRMGVATQIIVIENDRCQSEPNCVLENMQLEAPPTGGTFDVFTSVYTPNPGFSGEDSFTYSFNQDPSTPDNVDEDIVYIEVIPDFATTYTNAMDDYDQTTANIAITRNGLSGVLSNDHDPFNNVVQVGSYQQTAIGGSLDLSNDGSYTFSPAADYVGPVDFAYEVCRSNSTVCDSATLHLLVGPALGNGTISSIVFLDIDGNGLYNSFTEIGIPDVSVKLVNESFETVDIVETDVNGIYTFEAVPPGDYFIEFVQPPGLELTIANAGNDELNDSDVTGEFGPGTTDLFSIEAGESLESIKAGYYECVSIGDNVWYDENFNDVFDDGENGLNGLLIELFRLVDGQFVLWSTTISGQKPGSPSDDGWYNFCQAPGTYYVRVNIPPTGLVLVRPNIGNDDTRDSDITNANGYGTTNTFSVAIGQTELTIGAGFYPQAIVGNLVWMDENLDGIQNTFEQRVEGVLVQAYEAETNEMLGQSVTDADGVYMIDYLEKTDIYLKFYPPDGLIPTEDHAGWNTDLDSDVDGTFGENTTGVFSMKPGDTQNQIDMGLAFGALPVTWLSIDVKRDGNAHKVSWQVADQQNVESYIVQRMLEGEEQFTTLSETLQNAADVLDASYSAVDSDLSFDGKYFYRVKQVDIDGQYSYSDIVVIESTPKVRAHVYPNPATETVTVEIISSVDVDVVISFTDAKGKFINSRIVTAQEDGLLSKAIDVSDLQSGVYTITIQNGKELSNLKFVKIK